MIISILFYFFFAVALFTLGCEDYYLSAGRDVAKKRKLILKIRPRFKVFSKKTRIGNHPFATTFTIAIILLFTIISAMRYRVGADCESYVTSFESIISGHNHLLDQDFEKSYYVICKSLGTIGFGRVGFLGFWAMLDISLFLFALKDRRYLIPFALYALVLGPYYISWMNGLRQVLASMIFLVASVYLVDQNRRILYLFLILLAIFIHKSAVILIPLAFLPIIKTRKNKYILCATVLLSFIVGQSAFVNEFLNKAEGIIAILGYDNYSDRIDYFSEISNEMSIGPRRLLLLCISLCICWMANDMSSYFNDNFFDLSFSLFFIHTCFKNHLLINASSVFWRPFLYFEVFELIVISYFLVYLLKRYTFRSPRFIIGLFLISLYTCFVCLSAASDPEEAILYKLIFLQ